MVALSRRANLLAALHDRNELANGFAAAERENSGGDPGRGNPLRLGKLYPPYPSAVEERAAYLDRLAGLGKLNRSLSFAADDGLEAPEAAAVAGRLAKLPVPGLSGRLDGASVMGFLESG